MDWITLGTMSMAPFVMAWETTQGTDGMYERGAACAADPAALTAFQTGGAATNTSGSSSSSRCFTATAA